MPTFRSPDRSTPGRLRRWAAALATVLLVGGATTALGPAAQAAPATGANFIATGHDLDFHCAWGQTPSCDYLRLTVASVRKGSTLPVLAIDSGTTLPTALGYSGVTPVVTLNPANEATFNAAPFTDASGAPLYSAIVVASSSYVVSITPQQSTVINNRAADFKTFFNGGGGILALSSVGQTDTLGRSYYAFVPISITGSDVNPPFTPTAAGSALGITDAMINCCATHNSFAEPTDPVVVLERDRLNFAETIAAFDARISDGGFTADPVVTIDGGATVATNDTTPTISGTTDAPAGTAVTVTIGGQTLSGTVGDGGVWSVTAATLPEGSYPVQASVTVATKTGTATQTVVVDTTAPVVAVDGGATLLRNDPTPTLTGTTDAPAGSTVTVTVGDQSLTTTVTDAGTWSVTPATLSDGTYPVSVAVADAAGNPATATATLTVDTVGPALTVNDGAGQLTRDPAAPVSGSTDAPAGSTVTVTVGGQTLNATVGADATWSVTPAALADGEYTVTVSVSDAAGNTTTDTVTRVVDTTAPTVTLDGGSERLINTTTTTVAGSTDAPAGTEVEIVVGASTYSATVDGDGRFSTSVEVILDGTYPVTVTVPDAAGNAGTATQSLTVDTTLPLITIDGGRQIATNDTTPTLTGTTGATPGSTVTVFIADQSYETTVAPDGTWTVTIGVHDDEGGEGDGDHDHGPLTPGTYEANASVADEAGNVAIASQQLVVDLDAPLLSFDGPASVISPTTTPTVSGTTDLPAGATVTVTAGDVSATATVTADGTWSVTLPALPQGTVQLVATATDEAGNTSTAIQNLLVDSIAPEGTVDGEAQVLTNDPTPTLSGTTDLPEGAPVLVTIDGTTVAVPVGADGTWTLTPAENLPDGTYVVEVAFVDAAGNTTTRTVTWVIDTTAPTAEIPATNTADTTTGATISGTSDAPAGSAVAVTVAGTTYTTTVGEDGTWSVTTAPLAAGEYEVSVTVTDPAGNVGTFVQVLSVTAPTESTPPTTDTPTSEPTTPSTTPSTSAAPTTAPTTTTAVVTTTSTTASTGKYGLAYTGSSAVDLIVPGAGLLLLGGLLVFGVRRSRTRHQH